jgi:hypothetical protein
MLQRLILVLSVMLMVFSLTLAGGGATYMFYVSPGIADHYIQTTLFWVGALVGLFGLAGALAASMGVVSAILLKAAEVKQEKEKAEGTVEYQIPG